MLHLRGPGQGKHTVWVDSGQGILVSVNVLAPIAYFNSGSTMRCWLYVKILGTRGRGMRCLARRAYIVGCLKNTPQGMCQRTAGLQRAV